MYIPKRLGFVRQIHNHRYNFPDPRGWIGAWGYAVGSGELVSYRTPDLMGFCGPGWISPYHFTKALEYRIEDEGQAARRASASVRSLLLWGGADSTGTPYLEPVFVVDAPPLLPEAVGPWTIKGRDARRRGAVLAGVRHAGDRGRGRRGGRLRVRASVRSGVGESGGRHPVRSRRRGGPGRLDGPARVGVDLAGTATARSARSFAADPARRAGWPMSRLTC